MLHGHTGMQHMRTRGVQPERVKMHIMRAIHISVLELVDDIRHEEERILVLNSFFVQLSVVLHGAKFAILLLDKEEWGCQGRFGGVNIIVCEHVIEEGI